MNSSKHVALIIAVLIIVVIILILQSPFQENAIIDFDSANIGNKVGNLAPDFILTTPKGEKIQLSSFTGKPVIVNFWATWCAPCEEELPIFEEEFKNGNIQILAVNLQENGEKAQKWFDERGFTVPILLDPTAEAKNAYGVFAQPATFFLDKERIIKERKFGQLLESEFNEKLEKIL